MLQLFLDKVREYVAHFTNAGMGIQYEDVYTPPSDNVFEPRGEVFFELRDAETDEILEERHVDNVITKDMSILLARLCKDSEETNGLLALAMGTGDGSWDLQNPPAATADQRMLYSEISRKPFEDSWFVWPEGHPNEGEEANVMTNVVDFKTTFAPSEAVGPLVEMGLVGGDADTQNPSPISNVDAGDPYDPGVDVEGHDILANYLTFKVINKPDSAVMSIVWRITW